MAEDTTKRLIKQRKLVLILDLDKTLIHTTSPWPTLAVVQAFQFLSRLISSLFPWPFAQPSPLVDQVAEMWIRDGAHGIHAFQLGSHHGRYFTKIRPGLQSTELWEAVSSLPIAALLRLITA